MKNLKVINFFVLVFVVVSFVSCDKDDEINSTIDTNLIGEWQRSDFNEDFEFTYIFEANNKGSFTAYEADQDAGTAISATEGFTWSTNGNILTLDYDDGDPEISNYSINAEGQLLLSDLTDLVFNKLDE